MFKHNLKLVNEYCLNYMDLLSITLSIKAGTKCWPVCLTFTISQLYYFLYKRNIIYNPKTLSNIKVVLVVKQNLNLHHTPKQSTRDCGCYPLNSYSKKKNCNSNEGKTIPHRASTKSTANSIFKSKCQERKVNRLKILQGCLKIKQTASHLTADANSLTMELKHLRRSSSRLSMHKASLLMTRASFVEERGRELVNLGCSRD